VPLEVKKNNCVNDILLSLALCGCRKGAIIGGIVWARFLCCVWCAGKARG